VDHENRCPFNAAQRSCRNPPPDHSALLLIFIEPTTYQKSMLIANLLSDSVKPRLTDLGQNADKIKFIILEAYYDSPKGIKTIQRSPTGILWNVCKPPCPKRSLNSNVFSIIYSSFYVYLCLF